MDNPGIITVSTNDWPNVTLEESQILKVSSSKN